MRKAERSKQVVLPADRMLNRGITRDRSIVPSVLAFFTGPNTIVLNCRMGEVGTHRVSGSGSNALAPDFLQDRSSCQKGLADVRTCFRGGQVAA